MKTAAIYARVSTRGQAIDGTSLTSQVDACRAYASQHGYRVVKEIAEDISGARLDRQGLDEVRDLADRLEIEAVICYATDRLSRDLGHLMLLYQEFERNKIKLLLVNGPDASTPEGMMLLQMQGMFGQYERTKFQERSRRGKKEHASKGKVFTSWAVPYGYTYVEGEGCFKVLEDEATWAVKIFEWYVYEGMALLAIARRLNELGVPTKRGAAAWHPSTIASILKNSVYMGRWYYNKHRGVAAKKRRYADGRMPKREKSSAELRPQEDWIGVDVPALITEELFNEVAPQMERKARTAKRRCKREYLLRGLLRCQDCKRRLTARTNVAAGGNKEYSQYYCTGRYDLELRERCKCPWPDAPKLDERVWARLMRLFENEESIKEVLESHGEMREGERRREERELLDLAAGEQALADRENRFLDAYGKGALDLDKLKEVMAPIREQKEALKRTRLEHEARTAQRDALRAQRAAVEHLVAQAKRGLHLLPSCHSKTVGPSWRLYGSRGWSMGAQTPSPSAGL
jgi:site-specific DNA recombinase